MRVLLDSCLWGPAARRLVELGHDVDWVGWWQHDPGDIEILAVAVRENRILATFDKDFGMLVVRRRLAHCGILRLEPSPPLEQANLIHAVLLLYGEELRRGAIVTVGTDRVRLRPPLDGLSEVE